MNDKNALIGYSGFVGSTLLKQTNFDYLYRSTNISDIQNKSFDAVICAGAPAVKWMANKNPENDRGSIKSLISHLSTVKCRVFILISTVDVFNDPVNVNESSLIDTSGLCPYGLHRYELEQYVRNTFENHLIVRLPGLVGPGLKKNIIYDLLNRNNLDVVDCRSLFQFYPMVNLWSDIQIALSHSYTLVHLTSEPVSVECIARECFSLDFNNKALGAPIKYDFKSELGHVFSSNTQYQYTKKEVLLAIRAYAQSEVIKEQVL